MWVVLDPPGEMLMSFDPEKLVPDRDTIRRRLGELAIEKSMLHRLLRIADDTWLARRRLDDLGPKVRTEAGARQEG